MTLSFKNNFGFYTQNRDKNIPVSEKMSKTNEYAQLGHANFKVISD